MEKTRSGMTKGAWVAILGTMLVMAVFAVGPSKLAGMLRSERDEGPGLACEKTTVYHRNLEAPELEHDFVVVNQSNTDIRLTQISKSCSCLRVGLDSFLIPANEETKIRVAVHVIPKQKGTVTDFDYQVALSGKRVTSGSAIRPMILRLHGRYAPPAYFQQTNVGIDIRSTGDRFETSTPIYINRDENVSVISVETRGDLKFDAELQNAGTDDGTSKYAKLAISIRGKHNGKPLPQEGIVLVETSSEHVPTVEIPVTLRLAEDLQFSVSPPKLGFGVLKFGDSKTISFSITKPESQVLSFQRFEVSNESLKVRLFEPKENTSAGDLDAECTFTAGDVAGAFSATISVFFGDGEDELSVDIPVSGFVAE